MKSKTSKTLAAIVVSYRTLGLFKDQAKLAMIELMTRKENGELFDYESFIKNEVDKMPKSVKNDGFENIFSLIKSFSK